MDRQLELLIDRLRQAEPKHKLLLSKAASQATTAFLIRRHYLTSHSNHHPDDNTWGEAAIPLGERAWRKWHLKTWLVELAIAQLKDPVDRRILEATNVAVFGSSAAPAIARLMAGAEQLGADETQQYQTVLDWFYRPDLFSYRRKEFGGVDFRQLKPVRKLDPLRIKTKVVFAPTSDPEKPLRAKVDGKVWTIQVNEFPTSPLYTLIVGKIEDSEFDNWPKAWIRPFAQTKDNG
jgi:hypothetical protein